MPKTSWLNTKQNRAAKGMNGINGIGILLRGYAKNPYQLSKVLGIAPETAAKKLENPERFTIGELLKAGIAFGIPAEELLAKVTW